MQYNYISAGAGAGKTEWAIKTSVKFNYGGQNVLFIVPTIDLANSIEKRSGGLIKAIHNENSYFPVDVVREIFTQQAKTGVAPGAWVITEACFLLLGSFRFNCARKELLFSTVIANGKRRCSSEEGVVSTLTPIEAWHTDSPLFFSSGRNRRKWC